MRVFILILFGFAVWAIPFFLGAAIMPVVQPETALFDTIMSVVMAFAASLFSYLYLRGSSTPSLDQGLLIGTVWALISVALDIVAFTYLIGWDNAKMTPSMYIDDIALTYTMIPIIAAAIGHTFKRGNVVES